MRSKRSGPNRERRRRGRTGDAAGTKTETIRRFAMDVSNGTLGMGATGTPYVSALSGAAEASLRDELEKELISPLGLHLTRESCSRAWDQPQWSDGELRRQIGKATAVLKRCEPTAA